MKRALITGVTGQDGSYLAELLLQKGYEVYGLVRRKSTQDYGQAEHLKDQIRFLYGDMTDVTSLVAALQVSKPDEVYNLAAQSFVGISWQQPVATSEINGLGVLYLLEAMRMVNSKAKFYQASTSELFGLAAEIPQSESTPFHPRSPYGVAKLYGHWTAINYRESYGMFVATGILFNHESERRGKEFVSRKITNAVARIKFGLQQQLEVGNLDARRDWGHAEDYVRAMWLMLQRDLPGDYVVASKTSWTVRTWIEKAFARTGVSLVWQGSGLQETGLDAQTKKVLVKVNPQFFRPAEVHHLEGDPHKAEEELGWRRNVSFDQLVNRMVDFDLAQAALEAQVHKS